MDNDEKLVFDNLLKLQKWDAELFTCANKCLKNNPLGTLGYLTK